MGRADAGNQLQWDAVDAYFAERLIPADDVLEAALRANAAAGLPDHDVSPTQGKLLHIFARMVGARRILEIGTLGGYSTIWLARALPADGIVVTLEYEPRYAEVARANITRAGLGAMVDVRVGAALDTLPILREEGAGPFDLVFIDADKANNSNYFAWALKLTRPGSIIIVDNVAREGRVVDPSSKDSNIQGVRNLFDMLADEPRIDATAIQTVGEKGWDGFAIAIVEAPSPAIP